MPVTAPPKTTLIATALCDERDLTYYGTACHQAAEVHREATGHIVMVVETTVTRYEAPGG